MKKRIILFFAMAALLTVCALGVRAETYGNLTYSISDGEVKITDSDPSVTSVTIPKTIDGYPVTSIGRYAFGSRAGLTSVIIPNSVTSIGEGAFRNCTGLTSITIPNSVTSIDTCVFSGCASLMSVAIPDSVTSIGEVAFGNCTSLTSITIPNSVTSIGSFAFVECTGLTSVIIPNSVTSIGSNAFWKCTGLTSVIIPNSVTSIGEHAFWECTGLMSITLPDSVMSIGEDVFLDTLWYNTRPDGLIYINKVLYKYKGTMPSNTKIDIIPGTVCIADSAFSGCTGLTNITIPNSVINIGREAFSGCTGLTNISIPNSVTSIEGDTFSWCTGLTSIIIPNSVTSIGYWAFMGCTGLTSITIPNSVTSIDHDAFFETPWYKAKPDGLIYINKVLYEYKGTMPSNTKIDIIPGTVSISSFAFFQCNGLTNITIPDSVTSIGDYAFSDCTGLTNITIPDSVTSIEWNTFSGCTGLTSITIPASVAEISKDAFSGAYDEPLQLADIYYCGTEKEWKNINILDGNEPLFQATLHCAPELPNQLVLTIGQRTAHAFGHTKINDVAPVVVNGRTMLPVRFLAENLGATVAWNEEKQLVTITGKNQKQEDVTILITIGAANAQINGQSVALEAPAFVDQNRTFMPVRLIAEALGASVDWSEAEQKVIITKT